MEGMDFTDCTIDELEQFVTDVERSFARARAAQMAALRELDRRQAPLGDGCRSLVEWVTGRLDIAPDTAKTLVSTARRLDGLPLVEAAALAGEITFDRAAAVARLATPGNEETALEDSAGLDVAGIHRRAAQQRRLTRSQEQRGFRDRYVATQSNLDHTPLDFHGRMVGVDGRIFEEALHAVGDRLPEAPGVHSRATRNADALSKIAQDALDGNSDISAAASTPLVTVFVDAAQTALTGGETGVTVAAGPRVGPNTLEAMICTAAVEVTARTQDGTPLNIGRRSRVVPAKLRRYVLHRDGGVCTADGCVSRYRLEAHHITPWSQGGATDADNLTTLCWYHHHVIVHGEGFTVDPNTPPRRRRFLRPRDHDPP